MVFPSRLSSYKSGTRNLFLGYEGTPGYLWNYSTILSIILLGSFIYGALDRKNKNETDSFFLMVLVPLVIVIGISFIKPLFVNRYVIPVTVAETFYGCFCP